MSDLKEKTISGMIWTSIGKFGTTGMAFLSNLVLARLLMPHDYGCISMLQVFIAISTIFVTAGFGTALVQKKNPTHIDYTSVFYWNLAAAILFFGILYVCGPAIAHFYKMPELCAVLRVQSITLIIQAFSTVQSSQLQKQLRFKELSIRNIIATTVGTIVAIVMALCGGGVWSLVANQLVNAAAGVLLLWKMSTWRPTWEFSFQSLKELFSFGGLMALSSMIETLYANVQNLIIGRLYTASNLGYFNQAKKLEAVPTDSLSQIVNQVSFPIFASLKDDPERLLAGVRKNIKAITYLNFPLMALLIVIAHPLITLLYGARWENAVPYFQILCLSSMVYTMNTLNTNVIKSLGKGKIYFLVQLIKRLIGIGLIILGIHFGIFGLLWAVTSVGYICIIINAIVNKRLINYGIIDQIKDVGFCYLLSTMLAALLFYLGSFLPINEYLLMSIQIILYLGLYLLFSVVSKMEGYTIYKEILISKLKRKVSDHNTKTR